MADWVWQKYRFFPIDFPYRKVLYLRYSKSQIMKGLIAVCLVSLLLVVITGVAIITYERHQMTTVYAVYDIFSVKGTQGNEYVVPSNSNISSVG